MSEEREREGERRRVGNGEILMEKLYKEPLHEGQR